MGREREIAQIGTAQILNEDTVDYAFLNEVADIDVDISREDEDESDCEGAKYDSLRKLLH